MTSNFQLLKLCRNIKNFRGIFMRNSLPRRPFFKECAILNLDDKEGDGTHWVAFKKRGNEVSYFNSFGALPPPRELVKYLGKNVRISYNKRRYQSFRSNKCGLLCVKFLKNLL